MVTPNLSLKFLCTSTGSADPPAAATRRFAASFSTSTDRPPASFSAPSSPQYIVGTPAKKVMPSSCISCSAGPASNLGSITTVPPVAAPAFWITVWPKEWNSGSTHRNVSGLSGVDSEQRLAEQRVVAHVAVPELGALGLSGRA